MHHLVDYIIIITIKKWNAEICLYYRTTEKKYLYEYITN